MADRQRVSPQRWWDRCHRLIYRGIIGQREVNETSDQFTARTMELMPDPSKTRHPRLRTRWVWLGGGIFAVSLLATSMCVVPQVLNKDPCDRALAFASDLGLQLSSDDEAVSCEWHSSLPDSAGTLTVRTASHATREALLERSGVSEEIYRCAVSVNDGPLREELRRPNLERSEQVYEATAPNGHQLRISYDDGVDSGLLLTVSALQA